NRGDSTFLLQEVAENLPEKLALLYTVTNSCEVLVAVACDWSGSLNNNGNFVDSVSFQLSGLFASTEIIQVIFFGQHVIGDGLQVLELNNAFRIGYTFSSHVGFIFIIIFCFKQFYGGTFNRIAQFVADGDVYLGFYDLFQHR